VANAVLDRLRAEVTELVESHGQARGIGEFSRYASDPAGFFRDVLHCDPWSKQVEMGELVRDNPRTLVLSANGIGKDWCFARLALWWVYACRGFVILTGTTERTVRFVLMRELRRAFAGAPDLPGELFGLELRVDEETGIVAFTSGDNADRFQGIHHPRLLILATEAQGLSQEIFDAMAACATAPENRVCVYGNPTRIGPFYQAAQSGAWRTLSIPATEHPNVVNGTNEIPGGVSREWVEGIRAEYGETSPFYVSRVLARFPTEGSVNSLIRSDWLEPAYLRWEQGGLRPTTRGPVVGLDVARSLDRDESVAAVAQGTRLHRLVAWHSRDLTDTADRAIRVAREAWIEWQRLSHGADELSTITAPPVPILVDAPGVGSGAHDEIKRRRHPCSEWWGWRPSVDPLRHLNMRADAFMRVRELLRDGTLALPRDPALREELLAIEISEDVKGRVVIASKELIRAALGKSPDRLDACTLAIWSSAPDPRQEWRAVKVRW
jgi:hypothetical protein